MWVSYLIFYVCLSLIYIGIGALMYKHPPKKINYILGYRTTMSMKNKETWKFANVYWGKSFFIVGLLVLIPSIIIPIAFKNSNHLDTITAFFTFVLVLAITPTIVLTEISLRKKFDKDGNLK